MEVKKQVLATPVKFYINVPANEIKEKKEQKFNLVKDELVIPGFRKGTITRDIAEKSIGVQNLYKSIIDEIFLNVKKQHNIEYASDFKIYGLLNDSDNFEMEFVADVKPELNLPKISKETFNDDFNISKYNNIENVSDIELQTAIDLAKKENQKFEKIDKETLENYDIAIIDFEGRLVDEKFPFKNGSAKNFRIIVNKEVNGRKQFIDNFEDQIVGMKIGETRLVNVKFPDDYRDNSKAGKNAIFTVKLNEIQKEIVSTDDEIAKFKGFNSFDEFKMFLQKNIIDNKQKNTIDDLKKEIINKIMLKTTFSPIPEMMIKNELEKQWQSYIIRMGFKEKELLKKDNNAKSSFFDRSNKIAIETIKTNLLFNKLGIELDINVSFSDIEQHLLKITSMLQYTESKKKELLEQLKNDQHNYEFTKNATINEKVLDELLSYVKD